jgi:hypothetical protein
MIAVVVAAPPPRFLRIEAGNSSQQADHRDVLATTVMRMSDRAPRPAKRGRKTRRQIP